MKNNKKGVFRLVGAIIGVGLFMAVSLFAYLFITNLFTQDVLPEMENAVLPILADNGNDTGLYNTITSQKTNISNLDLKLDLLFLGLWIGSTIFAFSVAFFLPAISKFEFGTFIFIGIMIILLWLNFVEQIFSWYVSAFITDIFSASQTDLPIFTWYLENYIAIVTITLISILLVNQFSRKQETETDLAEQAFDNNTFDNEPINEPLPEESFDSGGRTNV